MTLVNQEVSMIKNNPVRCAAEGCAFYAVTLGGYCEECDVEAHRDMDESEWLDYMANQNEIEAREAQWAEEQEIAEIMSLLTPRWG